MNKDKKGTFRQTFICRKCLDEEGGIGEGGCRVIIKGKSGEEPIYPPKFCILQTYPAGDYPNAVEARWKKVSR